MPSWRSAAARRRASARRSRCAPTCRRSSLPTTYAGSEMTPILGETKDGVKTTQRTPKVLPEIVIYDVDLTLALPPAIAATSGINAMAHAVEALYARDRNPVISLMAEEGIRSLARALPGIVEDPQDREARARRALRRLAVRHLPRRGRHGAAPQALPRARRHLRPAARRDPHHRPAARRRLQRVGRAGGHGPHCAGHRRGRMPRKACSSWPGASAPKLALRDIGMPAKGIEQAVKAAMAAPYWNPRPTR